MERQQEERVNFLPSTSAVAPSRGEPPERTNSNSRIVLRRGMLLFIALTAGYSFWFMINASPLYNIVAAIEVEHLNVTQDINRDIAHNTTHDITHNITHDAEFVRVTSGPKIREPTPAQLEYWKRAPMPERASLPGTEFVFDELYRHQHPTNCSDKKFLVYTLTPNGIGSDMHVMSWALGVAYATGRILAYEPTHVWRWADVDFCFDKRDPDCYLEPLTSCPVPQAKDVIAHTYQGNGESVPEGPTIVHFRQEHSKYGQSFIPPTIVETMNQQKYQVDVSWWRAVTTNYLWRANVRFGSLLRDVYDVIFGGVDRFPQRAFGVHVRHGDKHLEMRLHGFRDYMATAEKMKKEHAYLAMSDVIILSTEDNAVMDEAAKWNAEHPEGTQWQFTYLNDKKVNNQHVITVARWHFVNAFMAAQADAFIITTGSNWCRVINELRKTRGKLNYALGDLEPGEWKRSIEQ